MMLLMVVKFEYNWWNHQVLMDQSGISILCIWIVFIFSFTFSCSHYHVVAILLREDSVSAPSTPPDIKYPSLSSFSTYTAAQDTYDGSADIAYIAAEFSDSLFPSNGDYIIGEETEPNDRSSTYTNGQLRYGTPYTFFLRAYPYLVSCMHALLCISICLLFF